MLKRRMTVTVLLMHAIMMCSMTLGEDPTYIEVWDGRGTDSLACEKAGEEGRPETGWIHWVFSTKGDSTGAELTLDGTGSGTFSPGAPLNANVWHFYTPYFQLEGLTASISLYGGKPGLGGGLVISDYCPGLYERLEVSKTAETSYVRTHDWSIEKSVDPEEIYLYADGSGDTTAFWTVDVTYEGYEDSGFEVAGEITILNSGSLPAVITSIVDLLGGKEIDINCGDIEFPYELGVGQTLVCSYLAPVEGTDIDLNTVVVTTKVDEYTGEAEVVWDAPKSELHATVKVVDISDLFGEQELGELFAEDYEAGDVKSLLYEKEFAWSDYGREDCGTHVYDNCASVIGDHDEVLDSACAALTVYVQCLIFEGETAWAANGDVPGELRYTNRGNWATYVEYAEKTTTLFAGQTIPVGTAEFSGIVGGSVTITISLFDGWEFAEVAENLKVQGYASAPSGNPNPGGFANKENCDSTESSCYIIVPAANFYGVHLDVGQWVPDPDFGP